MTNKDASKSFCYKNNQDEGRKRFFSAHPLRQSRATIAEKNDEKKQDKTVIAAFKAQKKLCTEALPIPPDGKSLDDFFEMRSKRNLLFSADATITDVQTPTDAQIGIFQAEASAGRLQAGMSAQDSNAITVLVEIANPPMSFIGIKLLSKVTVGTQLLRGSIDNSAEDLKGRHHPTFPEYQFTLVDSSFEAEGPKALVWMFNKIMKRDDPKERSANDSMKTTGFTRVWAEPIDDKNMVLCTYAKLESQIRIPRMMIAILPLSLEKLEQQGSNTLQASVERDITPAIERFKIAYLEWIQNNDQ